MSRNAVLTALRDAPHLSVSSIKTWMLCPRKYAFRYIDKTPVSHRSINLILGGIIHNVAEMYYRFLDDTGQDPPLEMLLDMFSDSWQQKLEDGPPVLCENLDSERDRGLLLVREFHASVPRPVEIIAVEHAFAIPLAVLSPQSERDLLIVGAIDAIVVDDDNRCTIVELKTAARRWQAVQLAYDIQPTIYQVAARTQGLHDNPSLRLDFLLKLKTPVFESVTIARPPEFELEAGVVLAEVTRAIDAGIFFPVRSWACKDCEFAYTCGSYVST
jgi:CRISPR/Cas system-associated exonuclease Cas4 (RecB family)